VVYGDGSLATVLAHYGVSLPDQATDVRFHDEESLIGSEGTLFLHFKVSDGPGRRPWPEGGRSTR
jgi:hypothetical protein